MYIYNTIVDLDGVLNNTWGMEGTRGARYSLLLAFLPQLPPCCVPELYHSLATGYDAVVHPVSRNNTRLHYSSSFCWVPPLFFCFVFFFALRGNDAMGGSRVDCRGGKNSNSKEKRKKKIRERWNEVWWSKWRVPLHKRLLPPRWRWKMCYMYIKQWKHISEAVCVAALLITICSVCDEWKYRLKGRSGVGLLIVTFLGRTRGIHFYYKV